MMRGSSIFITVFLLLWSLFTSCEVNDNPSFPNETSTFMRMTASDTTIGVGLDASILIAVQVTKDGTGDTSLFSATSGSFLSQQTNASIEKIVDVDGNASADRFPPDEPGTVRVTARIQTVAKSINISVTPVTQIDIIGLPDSIALGQSVLFRAKVPSQWHRKPIEIRAPDAILKATGPVDQDLDAGTRILPLADETGEVAVIFTAPNMPMKIIITASMFGTRRSKQVVVN